MNEEWTELLANLPAYLGGHMLLSISALAVGIAISLPLGIGASRRPKTAEALLSVAGVIQTVPSLALLGLMVLFLGGLIGFWPAFMALVLYSILPIVANTVVGLRGVDGAYIEAARGLGMSERQMLWRVQLPLAAPVILSGIRTAAVLVVGTATLATQVGGLSLGNYIFAGLSMLNHTATLFGCVAAALLAVGFDQLIGILEIAARRRSKPLGVFAAAGLLLVTAGGLYEPVKRWWLNDNDRVVVSSTPFTEQYILSHVLSRRLGVAGFATEQRDGMAYGISMAALQQNRVDCLVTYSGDVWSMLMKRKDTTDRVRTLALVKGWLETEFGVVYVGTLGFEDAYAIALATPTAERWNVKTIADLAHFVKHQLGRPLKVGGDDSFFERKEWHVLKKEYGFDESAVQIVTMSQTLMYGAVGQGNVDAIVAYTSDGRVKAENLKLLADPLQVFPPYDAILVASPAAAARPGFLHALAPLVDSIDLETMQEANRRVDMDKELPSRVSLWLLQSLHARPKQRAALKGGMP